MIEHTVRVMPKKRQKEDLEKKHEKIGELLGLEKVPLHTLAWKEPRLDLGSGDCYPVVDVLERLAVLMEFPKTVAPNKKKPAFTSVKKKDK